MKLLPSRRAKNACFILVRTSDGEIRETFQSHFFGMTWTGQYGNIFGRNTIFLVKVFRDNQIVIGDNTFDSGNNELVSDPCFQLFR